MLKIGNFLSNLWRPSKHLLPRKFRQLICRTCGVIRCTADLIDATAKIIMLQACYFTWEP